MRWGQFKAGIFRGGDIFKAEKFWGRDILRRGHSEAGTIRSGDILGRDILRRGHSERGTF